MKEFMASAKDSSGCSGCSGVTSSQRGINGSKGFGWIEADLEFWGIRMSKDVS